MTSLTYTYFAFMLLDTNFLVWLFITPETINRLVDRQKNLSRTIFIIVCHCFVLYDRKVIGLLVGQIKPFEDVTLGFRKL